MWFSLDVDDSAAVRRLDGLSDRAGNMRPALRHAGDVLQRGFQRQFQSRGRHFAEPWPPLAPATVERKAAQGLSTELLHATGALEATISRRGAARVAGDEVRVGLDHPALKFHQGGTPDMPARPLVGVARGDRGALRDLVSGYLIRGLVR